MKIKFSDINQRFRSVTFRVIKHPEHGYGVLHLIQDVQTGQYCVMVSCGNLPPDTEIQVVESGSRVYFTGFLLACDRVRHLKSFGWLPATPLWRQTISLD